MFEVVRELHRSTLTLTLTTAVIGRTIMKTNRIVTLSAVPAIGRQRFVETTSLAILAFFCLWLTLFAIFGNYFSISLILSLIFVFAAAKEPYRKGFIASCFIVGLFVIYPFDITVTRGDRLNIRPVRVSYGLSRVRASEKPESESVIKGGCVVTPFSPQWRLLVTVP